MVEISKMHTINPFSSCSCKTMKELSAHLSEDHGKNVKIGAKAFDTYEDFLKWKQEVEKETNSLFVQYRQMEKSTDFEIRRFYCS